jgi:hypothetical protein
MGFVLGALLDPNTNAFDLFRRRFLGGVARRHAQRLVLMRQALIDGAAIGVAGNNAEAPAQIFLCVGLDI